MSSWREDVVACLHALHAAQRALPEDLGQCQEIRTRLNQLTQDPRKVFQGQPLEKHAELWEAIYVARNAH